MDRIVLLQNQIQNYEWGSRTVLAELLGLPAPSPKPEAELWMGAHPAAPSQALVGQVPIALPDLIARSPADVLGASVAKRFGGELPFLFKVLAADQPLSIQAHPNREQAREGYEREEQAAIPVDSPRRNYKDRNHKPEIICALSPTWLLSGFRPPDQILELLHRYQVSDLLDLSGPLQDRAGAGQAVARFYRSLMELPEDKKKKTTTQVVTAAERLGETAPEARWILRAAQFFPGDYSIVSILVLNLVHLAVGEALYQKAGLLHAYLDGSGVELMANSDNVLRGGLTRKHVDVPELLRILTFEPSNPKPTRPRSAHGGLEVFGTGAEEFELSRLSLRSRAFSANQERSVEIWILLEGEVRVSVGSETVLQPRAGQSFLVPAAAPPYRIEGTGLLFRASVPSQALPGPS